MTRLRSLASVLGVLAFASAAYAQDAPAPPAVPTQGPLVLERVHNGMVVAPDYKVTELNGDFAQLAGAYVGRVFDDHLLIGGAGYWLANGTRGTELQYGGVMVGWTTAPGRIRFGARGLVGGGSGSLAVSLADRLGGRIPDPRMVTAGVRDVRDIAARFGVRAPPLVPTGSLPSSGSLPSIRVREDFFVFEPQLSAVTKVTGHLAVDVAAGYRLTSGAEVLGDRLNGATCSLGLQFGW